MFTSVREPAVAGAFYPASPVALRTAVEGLLADAAPGRAEARPKAIIVPHAGYVYSGRAAASAFALLRPFGAMIRRAVVVGPAHRVHVEGLAWPGAGRLKTPLGDVDVDRAALALVPDVAARPDAHEHEHSVEVELPFLQIVAPAARVVPLVVGRASPGRVADAFEALWGGPETVVVVSSDLSHYLPYELGRELDRQTCARIVALDPPLSGDEACGAAAVNGLLVVARRKNLRAELVDRRSSGDAFAPPRGRDEVVGYGAFAFYE